MSMLLKNFQFQKKIKKREFAQVKFKAGQVVIMDDSETTIGQIL